MQEVANDELMPPKRRLFRFKMACDIWIVRMTCSYPSEAWRPVTIVVTYKDRGDSPFTHEVSLNDARVRVAQGPLREVPTGAGDLFVVPVWDNVTHTTLTISTDVNRPTVSRLDQRVSFSHRPPRNEFITERREPRIFHKYNDNKISFVLRCSCAFVLLLFRISFFHEDEYGYCFRHAVPVANMHKRLNTPNRSKEETNLQLLSPGLGSI